jgi:hypothetical protein
MGHITLATLGYGSIALATDSCHSVIEQVTIA